MALELRVGVRRGLGRWPGLLLAGAVLALAACAAAPPADPLADDPRIGDTVSLARDAFADERFPQAALLYERALSRAYARDDVVAIRAVGYELALTYYRLRRFRDALDLAVRSNAQLRRRGEGNSREITLVEAWARHRLGEDQRALMLTREIRDDRAGRAQDDVAVRAAILDGYLAAGRGDAKALEQAIASVPTSVDATTSADLSELRGYRYRLQGEPAAAAGQFLASAEQRRAIGDVEGIARSLGLAAEATERGGQAPLRAADLYARAARSAINVSPPAVVLPEIERWARAADRLAVQQGDAGLQQEVQQLRARISGLDGREQRP